MNLASELRARGIDPARCTVNGKPVADEPPAKRGRGMNKWETLYSLELEQSRREGMILAWWYDSINLRLADRTWYRPDFCIVVCDGRLTFVEIKGFLRDDAAVKFKVAREMYPHFGWRMLRKTKHGWERVL